MTKYLSIEEKEKMILCLDCVWYDPIVCDVYSTIDNLSIVQ